MSNLVCPECFGVISVPVPGHARCRWCRWAGPVSEATEEKASVMSEVRVSDVRLIAAAEHDVARGLLGFISFVLGGTLRIDGVTLRRGRNGRLSLSFPERRDGQGRAHPILKPLDESVRREIERQVFAALAIEDDVRA